MLFRSQVYLPAPGILGGSKERARKDADELVKLDPAWGYLALAEIAAREDQKAQIPELYHKAHDAAPERPETAQRWCSYLATKRDWAPAEKCARDLSKANPERAGAYSLLAFVYAAQQRWSDVDVLLATAEKMAPDNLIPYYQAGWTAVDFNDLPRAERYLRKYLSQEPEPGMPRLSRAHWRLAQALEKQGRKPEAVAELEAAVRLEPGLEGAEKDLKRLRQPGRGAAVAP